MKVGVTMKKVIIISFIMFGCLFLFEPVKDLIFADTSQDSQITIQADLTQEQAKELLIKYNNTVDYIYQGDENKFEALKSKDLHGYVFLPDVETDIGYFVDKKTCQIYFFHPSGYLELAN